MAAMIVGFKVNSASLLQVVIDERAFKVTTTYSFPFMIFFLCRSVGVPIWRVYQLKTPLGTVDIGLIRDKTNVSDPHIGPHLVLPPLGHNLANMVTQACTATQEASTDSTPVESIPCSSTAPNSSHSAPFLALVVLARVQKLEAQMDTLLHHIQPWMQSSIVEAAERLERRMVQHTERKIDGVHQHLDAFELRVSARPSLQVDLLIL